MPDQKQKTEKQIPPEDIQRRVQDLETQQAKLKRENEELRKALSRLENSWAKYYELYEQSPIGYFIIGKEGLIQEVNPSGANLFGIERRKLKALLLLNLKKRTGQPSIFIYLLQKKNYLL